MVKAKKQTKDKAKPTVKSKTLKDLSVKGARKVKGGAVDAFIWFDKK
jgi:hypothetical protein